MALKPQWTAVGPALFVGGYENPFYNDAARGIENDLLNPTALGVAAAASGGLCAPQTKSLRQLTGGIWHTYYQGPFGKIRARAQYSYTVHDRFVGFGGTPRGTENMVYTSLRDYPFDEPVAITLATTK